MSALILTPYQIALKEIGVKEIPGDESNPRILEYHQATSLKADDEATPWCAAFVCWCLVMALKYGWVGSPSTAKANARSYLKWGISVIDNPQEGDICIFSRGKSKSLGHVTFFVRYSEDRKKILCLGGNQGDKVCYAWYPVSRLLDIRRSVA